MNIQKDFKKKRNIKKISISIDKKINDKLSDEDINKSKFVNFLIEKFFISANYEENIKNFKKSS